MIILAIDPGSSAAYSYVEITAKEVRLLKVGIVPVWDKEKRYASAWNLMKQLSHMPDVIAIEKVRSRPDQGIASTAKFMMCTGVVKGALEAYYKMRVMEIDPSVWKPTLGVTKDKKTSLRLAQSVFGREPFRLLKDHDKAEASLIALFVGGWRMAALNFMEIK